MKIKYIAILTISLLAFNANASSNDTTLHDNEVCLHATDITNFVPDLVKNDWYSVTSGQPFEGIGFTNSDGNQCLDIKSGRKNDSSNAEWVKNRMESAGIPWDINHMTFTLQGSFNPPEELNFAVSGTLVLTRAEGILKCYNVHIGQGHSTADNWWIFNNDANATKYNNSLFCHNETKNEDAYLVLSARSGHTFNAQYYPK